MIRRQRWLRYGMLTVTIALAFAMGGSSAGGQAPDERDEIIARLRGQIAEKDTLIADRDTLIAAQESLLNDYRCQFDIDTQLVPGGCAAPAQPTPVPTPEETLPPPDLPAGTTEDQWEQLRQCNANGDYQYANPNGINFGAYQFRQTSWDDLARRHYPRLVGFVPSDATSDDQDRMAYALYGERGWQPWPVCAAPFLSPGGTAPTSPTELPPVPAGTTQAQWDQLIQCESGGNYRAYNPAGPYLGAFQFNQPTWNGVAARHYPHLVGVDPRDATPANQHRMAYALHGERGWQPWPQCGAPFRSS